MMHLLCHSGCLALSAALRGRPLLAFDFDGTLAPIVLRPEEARVPAAIARRLERLARYRPLAIITGRTVADVKRRLDFLPQFIVGNHGAEDPGRSVALDTAPLDALRMRIRERDAELSSAGVLLEDKRFSLALHYRLAPDPFLALKRIGAISANPEAGLRAFGGKAVVNVVLQDAPDKGDAVASLVERADCDSAIFVGDDVGDEAVFERALPNWLTVRVGVDDETSRARFYLNGYEEMEAFLDAALRVLGSR